MGAPAAASDPFLGTIIADRYRIVRLLGKGGMGAVYEAEHVTIGRRVAIKRLAAELGNDSEVFGRFRREAEIIAGFQHPHIVGVLDWVTLADGSPCIVMEHLKGEDLAARIARRGPMDWPELAHIADEVLSALSVAHRAGIVHRDLKPQNIFLAVDDEGLESVKLLDFGVSKIHDSSTLATPETTMIGTPAYMAPEQARGNSRQVDAGTDVWAMGVVLFQMATGTLPFDGDSVPATLYRICHEPPGQLEDHRGDVPPAFAAALAGCLRRVQSSRTSSAGELRQQLRAALGDRAPGVYRNLSRRSKRSSDSDALGSLATPISGTAVAPTQLGSSDRRSSGVETTLSSGAIQLACRKSPGTSWLSALTLVACMLIGAGAVLWSLGTESGAGPGDEQDEPSTRAGAPRPEPAPREQPQPAESEPVTARPAPVTMTIRSAPRGANVFDQANRYLGITPLSYQPDATSERLKLTLRLPGYRDLQTEVAVASGETELLSLEREASRTRRRHEPAPPKPAPPKPATTAGKKSAADPPAGDETADDQQARPSKQLRGPYAEDI